MAINFAAGSESIQTPGNFSEIAVATITFWVQFSNIPGGNSRIIGTDNLYEVRLAGNDMLHEFRQSAVPNMTIAFVANQWYHIALWWDGTQKKCWVNGAVNVTLGNYAQGAVGTTNQLTLGSSDWNINQGMAGDLEDVRFYNRILSDKEVAHMYTAEGQDGIYNGLIHWWRMDQGPEGVTVVSEPDLVGKVNMTAIIGTPTYSKSPRTMTRRI